MWLASEQLRDKQDKSGREFHTAPFHSNSIASDQLRDMTSHDAIPISLKPTVPSEIKQVSILT